MRKKYIRKFLNKKEGTAFIEISSELSICERFHSYEGRLKLSDCNRIVTLDFDVNLTEYQYTSIKEIKQEAKERLQKAKILKECIDQLVEDLEYVNENINSLIVNRE